jgi:hypothetical protein
VCIIEECDLLGCYALRHLVRTDVSEERVASIILVTRIGELGTTLAVTSNQSTQLKNTVILFNMTQYAAWSPILVTLMMKAIRSSYIHWSYKPRSVHIKRQHSL